MIKKFNQFVNEEAAKDVGNLTGIIDTKVDWFGEDPENKSKFYEDFKKPIHSVRATFINLKTYATKHNVTSIKAIVSRWSLGKSPEKLDEKEQQNFNDYLNALKRYSDLDADTVIEYNSGNFVVSQANIVNLFKLVQGIILHESGHLDKDDLGEYESVKEIVVAAFELETKDSNSPPAYKKYGVDLESEEYKNAKAAFLNNGKVEDKEKKEVASTDKEKEPVSKKDAFKKILKDFK